MKTENMFEKINMIGIFTLWWYTHYHATGCPINMHDCTVSGKVRFFLNTEHDRPSYSSYRRICSSLLLLLINRNKRNIAMMIPTNWRGAYDQISPPIAKPMLDIYKVEGEN